MDDIPEPQVFGLSPVYRAYKGLAKILVLYARFIFDTEMRNLDILAIYHGSRARCEASLAGEYIAVLRGHIGLVEFVSLYGFGDA